MSENDVPVSNQSDEDINVATGQAHLVGSNGSHGAQESGAGEDVDEDGIAQLDEALEKFVAQKRWSDVIKTTLAKAELVADSQGKVELYAEAGRLYLERSPNQSEAVKCFQRVLELDPNNLEAMARLKDMYEKRRDWERLVEVRKAEVSLMAPEDQLEPRVEIALLATERLRKPAVCIELWQDVLAVEPGHEQALVSLSSLYERAREWEPLSRILERQSESTADEESLVTLLTKLGSVYADKLGNDEGAISAYQRLLALRPDDRRAQEQIKKRYVSARRWDELEGFYDESDKWEDLIRTLERAAETPGVTEEEAVELQFRIARIWLEKRDKADRAARAYEKVLAVESQNLQAAEALAPIYEAAGDAKRLVAVNEVRIDHTADPLSRVDLLRANARLHEQRLRSPEAAFDCLLKAFAVDPLDPDIQDDLERVVSHAQGQQPRLFDAYSSAIDAARDPDDAADLRLRYGRLLRDGGAVEQAIAVFTQVLEARPEDGVANGALADLYEQTGRYSDLQQVLVRRAESCVDAAERRALAYRIAALLRDRLEDAEGAIAAYRAIVADFGEDEGDAYAALDDLYAAQGRWVELAESLQSRIDLGTVPDERLAELKFRLSGVYLEHLSARDRALSTLHEVLLITPSHQGAIQRLEGLLSDDVLGGAAARLLEPLYEESGNWAKLVQALSVSAAFADDVESKNALLTRVGELQAHHLGDGAAAYRTYADAMANNPGRADIAARLEELATEQERVPDLVVLLTKLAQECEEPQLARSLYLNVARLQDEELDDVDGAVAAYRQILATEPGDPDVLLRLEGLYRRAERWQSLMEVLRERVVHCDDSSVQEDLLFQIAFIQYEMLSDPGSAIRVYGEVLEINPESRVALGQLDRLYEAERMWAELADNIVRQLGMSDDERQRITLMLRLAALRESRMGEVPGAIEIYREVLKADPGEPQALQALQRLLQTQEYQQLIAGVLEPIYRESGQYGPLIEVYEIQLHHSGSADERVQLLHTMAELHETALQNLEAAFQCQARALVEEPANLDTQVELERLATTLNHWGALSQVYEEQAPRVEDAMLSAALCAKAADIRESQLGDAAGAVSLYRRVLELDPRNVDAASALERLYYNQENYEDLAQVYLTKASMMEVPDDKREHLFRAAEIYEQILGRPEQAVAVYERSLGVEPDDVEALDRLIELRSRQGEWRELLDAYQKKADIVVDLDEKKALYTRVGQVYEERLQQPERAIEVYQRVLEIDPIEPVALGRLDALYLGHENWDGLLSILEKEVELATDEQEAVTYRYRIGELFETHLAEPFRAVDVYRDVLQMAPGHRPTITALQRMIASGSEPVAAAQVLEPVYRSAGEAEPLVAVLEVLVAHDEDPVRKVEVLHQIAELQELHVGNAAAAFDALSRALPYDVENEHTLESLERLSEGLGAFERLALLYDTQVSRLREEDPQYSVELALRLAQIFEIRIGNVDSAIERYAIVVEQEPTHREALGALDRLYGATGRYQDLAPILRNEIEISTDPQEILEHRFRLGHIYQQQLGDLPAAVEQYREVLAVAPDHAGAIVSLEQLLTEQELVPLVVEILEPIYRGYKEYGKLIQLAAVRLETLTDSDERVSLIQRVVEIAEDQAGDVHLAFSWAQQAALEDAGNELVLIEVERLAEAVGGWSQLADTYAMAAEAAAQEGQAELAVALGRRLAELYSYRLGDVERAEESLRYVVGIAPRDPDALAALERIYQESGAGEALATVLQRRFDAAEDTFDKLELGHRLAEVLYNEVGRTEDAVRVLTHILDDLDGEHEASLRLLQNIYTATKRWRELYACYERELKIALGDTMRSEILGRMAHLASSELGEPQKAVDLLRQVLELLGEEPAALNALGNLYALAENWTDLVDVLEREVAVTDDDAMRVAIYNDLGRIWYEKLNRDRNALDSWERVLDIDPNAVAALLAIACVHRNAGSTGDLVDTLHRVLDCPPGQVAPPQLEAVHIELAELYAQRLQQPADAVEQYRRALEVAPHNLAVMDALERIFAEQEQWEDAVELLHQRAAAFDEPASKIEVLLQVAALWTDQLAQPDGARAAYDEILQLDPEHRQAFEHLEDLHRSAGRYDELIELYIVRVETAEDPAQRVDLLSKVAVVYEKDLDDKNQAFDALLLAWQQDFTNEDTADALERVAGLTQRWNEVLTTANGALQLLRETEPTDDTAQNAICLKCARWYAREGHPEYAIPYLQQVLRVDTTNRGAMMQMADLHRQMQDFPAYSLALNKLAEMTEEPEDKAAVLVRMGALQQEQLGSAEQAIEHYRAALAAVPGHAQALRALESLYSQQQQWDELVNVLRQRIDGLQEPSERKVAKLALADVYENQLSDPARAIEQYRNVLEDDPDNLQALRGLERQHTELEQWPELLEVLEKQLDIVGNERDQVELLMRIAGMWEEEFLKPERAAARLEEVLQVDPLHSKALDSLVRLYRVQRKWDELIQTHHRLVDVADSAAERAEVYGAIGGVCRDQLKDPERAIDAYLNVLENDDDSLTALTALAELYEEREDHQQALDTMERLAGLVDSDEERVELFCKMGQLYEGKLQDRSAAAECFQRATDIDNTHLPSLLSLRDIHLDRGEFHAAARVLERAADAEESSRKKSIMWVELGRIYEVHLKEHDAAMEAFERARGLDPDNVEAALPLVDEYVNAARYADAEPLLQMLVRNAGRFDENELQRMWFTYGECADKLGDDATAVKAYGRAFELDAQDLPALMGLASAHYRRKEWDDAFKYYQMVLVHHRDALSPEETTDAFYRLGVIKGELGDRRKALNMFEKALEEDPSHRPTLEAVLRVHEQSEEWEQVIHFKKRILDGCEEPAERFALFSEIGELWQRQLDNPAAAIEAFVEAAEIQPEDHKMLHRLLELYLKTAQWEAVIDVINRISAVDDRAQVRAKNAYTIGVILRDELKDQKGALQHFNEALDLDPLGQLKAFEAINKILKGNWKELERAFRKMLHRISGQGEQDLEFNLWHNLGTLYRDRLSNMVAAAEAFAMASRLQPQNMQEHQILAEVYARVPGRIESAIAEHQILLKHDPNNEGAYRALYKLYFDARAYDKAWCVAATLNYLQKCDGEHRKFYEQYKADGPIRPRSRLTDELWVKELFHPEENLLVGKIFESVTPAMLQWHRVSDKRLDLKKKQEVTDLANTTIALARTFGFVNQVFGLGFVPRLFVCPDRSMGLEFATTIPPASVCGNTLLSGVSPLDVIFVVGRHLAFYRPEHYVRTMLQTKDQLKLVLAAAMRIAGADISDPNVESTAKELQANGRMQPAQLELLKKIGRRFADAGARADIKAWMRSTELTAARAGFLMCNDIGIAARMVQSLQTVGAVELAPRERVQDLVLFSVSENYFRLREALGITIRVG